MQSLSVSLDRTKVADFDDKIVMSGKVKGRVT